jgi:glycine/D-amino acid oxidase-like deaminating enzyme
VNIAVIGGGMFGAMAALRLREIGEKVTIFERSRSLCMGASLNNQNRLHLGYHYPRDMTTAKQCVDGFERFRAAFPGCLLEGFTNAYFVASEGSRTSAQDYLEFADALGLPFRSIDPRWFRPSVHGVSAGIEVKEIVYDVAALRTFIGARLWSSGVSAVLGCNIDGIRRSGTQFSLVSDGNIVGEFDTVVNCTYADINRLGALLGHEQVIRQYEYTAVAVVSLDLPPVGITIMDGRFMTLLPFGNTGHFLLYHVDHAVIESSTGKQMPATWRAKETAPASSLNRWSWFERLRADSAKFVPKVAQAGLVDILEGPRMVLARRDESDPRPSFIDEPEPGYITVFAGKIDHSIWLADEIADRISAKAKAA